MTKVGLAVWAVLSATSVPAQQAPEPTKRAEALERLATPVVSAEEFGRAVLREAFTLAAKKIRDGHAATGLIRVDVPVTVVGFTPFPQEPPSDRPQIPDICEQACSSLACMLDCSNPFQGVDDLDRPLFTNSVCDNLFEQLRTATGAFRRWLWLQIYLNDCPLDVQLQATPQVVLPQRKPQR